jgi:arylsulfatase A-like enzyme
MKKAEMACWMGLAAGMSALGATEKPNVVMIYFDDLGYSDMGAYETTQTSLTPRLDTFAAEGMRFTAGHSADGVCTPSRYAIVTGRYCWRTSRKTGVAGGYSESLIEDDRFTFAKMFQSLGYTTAMVGKWHIGMQFYGPGGTPYTGAGENASALTNNAIDFSIPLTQTPTSSGFDYYFGTAASLDMQPYVWIENETVLFKGGFVTNGVVDFSQARPATNADLEEGEPIGAINDVRDGAYDPTFIVSDYLQVQAQKVGDLLAEYSTQRTPFFLYIPMPAPHKPWAVQSTFSNSTSYSYGDYIRQADHYAGVILDALADPDGNPDTDDSLVSNTVVFVTSDNGPETYAYEASRTAGRDSNGPFRGVKRDNWEGGTRVPFLVRWPGKVAPGTLSDHACWQGDFFATMAAYLGYDFSADEAPDSESFLPVLFGDPLQAERREGFVQHAMYGQHAIVDKNGEWKLLDGSGGDGNGTSYDADDVNITSAKGTHFGASRQLFNLLTDPGERTNRLLSATQDDLDKESELYALLNEIRGNTTWGLDGDSQVPSPDNDLDGMPNLFENTYAGLDRDDPSDGSGDFEPDGLTNLEESQNGADPTNTDTDDDRLSDYAEVYTYGTLPGSAHSDTDTLGDGNEVLIWHTNPLVADTDGDGVDDDDELTAFSNPRNAASSVTIPEDVVMQLDPVLVQLAGVNGTTNDPQVLGTWDGAGTLFARERTTTGGDQQWRTRLFLSFDLSGMTNTLKEARLRVYQTNRLNTVQHSDIALARVTDSWGTTAGSYPLFDETGVADSFVFGNNSDFGTAVDASGFYSGTAGGAGDDSGFDVTSMVRGWLDGSTTNYGFRIALNDRSFAAAAFSALDDSSTIGTNEALQLILTTTPPLPCLDSDGDGLLDAYEMSVFGNLDTAGFDDGDGDGVRSLVEQALGSDPTTNASLPVVELMTTNDVELSYHCYNKAALGVEVLVSEDLTEWESFTRFYRVADPAPVSDLGADYDKVRLEPHATLPATLFYKLNIHTGE